MKLFKPSLTPCCLLSPAIAGTVLAVLAGFANPAAAEGKQRVGSYLYAPQEALREYKGKLTLLFEKPGDKLVIAYGYKNRKNRQSRDGTTEEERDTFKPVKALLKDDGRKAVFRHLAPDLYDILIIVPETMQFYEGLMLYRQAKPASEIPLNRYHREVADTLSVDKKTSYGWEAFFDTKTFERLETDGRRGGVLLQQLRRRKTLAASGDPIAGCIHSIDICWVEKIRAEDGAWQVIDRQQLYREELESRDFFKHRYLPALRGILIGVTAKTIGPIDLPDKEPPPSNPKDN